MTTGAATITGDTAATLNGTVNPDGEPIEECLFEYGPTDSYGQSAPCAESNGEIGTGTAPKAVHADISGLASESLYHFRLIARNANDTTKGPDQAFQTPTKPAISEEWADGVKSTEATLKASINPGSSATTFQVEWGTDTGYGNTTAEAAVGSDASDHTVSVPLSGLAPSTTYHWRTIATNSIGTTEGPDRSFRTFPEAPAGLPDKRVNELVSPLNKGGGEVGTPTPAGGGAVFTVQPQQSSPSGEAITYASATPFGEDPESAPASSQYLSHRDAEGNWTTANINPRFEEGYLRDPIVGFSTDLSHAAAIVFEPELTADAAIDVPNIYWRDNVAGALTTLTTEANHPQIKTGNKYCLYYGGASTDSSRVFFAAKGALLAGDPVGNFNLYEWSAAQGLRLVSVLPGEAQIPAKPVDTNNFGGQTDVFMNSCDPSNTVMRHAISADGSKAIWTYGGSIGTIQEPLLDRVNGTQTIQLDAPNEGTPGKGGEGKYWDASLDGSKVFFTTTKKLTSTPTTAGSSDLYLYDFDKEAGERLTDLTAYVGEAADVKGVLGAGEDGDYAYFVATGALDAGAISGEYNLYAWHEGDGVRFLSTLGESDASNWDLRPDKQTARVSPDGTGLAFLSNESLTGFDNVAEAGSDCKPSLSPQCAQAFLYDYATDSLDCASCNPSGSRPLGPADLTSWSTPYEQPRYLSDDGERLFFETLDALDPHDTNEVSDVYEFERPGVGSCKEASPTYNPDSNGCLYLISSGQSTEASYFLDASSSGDDAFISTREGLIYTDKDGRYDVYDAKVGGSPPPPPPQICEGEGCVGAIDSPPPSTGPGTGSFQGPADPAPKRGCSKGRKQIRKGGKTRCVKPAQHHGKKHKRANRNGRTGR